MPSLGSIAAADGTCLRNETCACTAASASDFPCEQLDSVVGAQRAVDHCAARGPPFLCSAPSWGQALLRDWEPTHKALRSVPADAMHVWAHWPSAQAARDHGSACTLVVRRAGKVVARAETARLPRAWEPPLRLTLDISAVGEGLVAELRCGVGGRTVRHLHLDPPRDAERMRFDGLLLLRGRPASSGTQAPAPLFPPGVRPERGFGVEMETLVLLPCDWDERSGLDGLWARLLAGCGETEARERCARWRWTHDDSLQGVPAAIVRRLLDAYAAETGPASLTPAQIEVLRRLVTNGPGTHRSEFKSPSPPHELRFSRDGETQLHPIPSLAPSHPHLTPISSPSHPHVPSPTHLHPAAGETQLRSITRVLHALPAVAAAPFGENGRSGSSLHVHVNVCSPSAGGPPLSARQILAVWTAWARFDRVTARLVRPWMRRSPSCAPLFATGPEMWSGPSHVAANAWDDPSASVRCADAPAFPGT